MMHKKTVTAAVGAVNRANSQHSPGPPTKERKSRSSQNALRNGTMAPLAHIRPPSLCAGIRGRNPRSATPAPSPHKFEYRPLTALVNGSARW